MFPHQVDNNGKLKPKALLSSNVVLTSYGGSQIKHHTLHLREREHNRTFLRHWHPRSRNHWPANLHWPEYCAIQKQHPLTSSHGCPKNKSLGQVKETTLIRDKQDLTKQYPECFDGIGNFPGEYHITVYPNVPPVIHPPRRVPVSLKDDIKTELDDMVKNGIITKLEESEPTPWVNSLIYSPTSRAPKGKPSIWIEPSTPRSLQQN